MIWRRRGFAQFAIAARTADFVPKQRRSVREADIAGLITRQPHRCKLLVKI